MEGVGEKKLSLDVQACAQRVWDNTGNHEYDLYSYLIMAASGGIERSETVFFLLVKFVFLGCCARRGRGWSAKDKVSGRSIPAERYIRGNTVGRTSVIMMVTVLYGLSKVRECVKRC